MGQLAVAALKVNDAQLALSHAGHLLKNRSDDATSAPGEELRGSANERG